MNPKNWAVDINESECSQCKNWWFDHTVPVLHNPNILIGRGKCSAKNNVFHSHWFLCDSFEKGRRDNNELREEEEE